MRTIQPASYNVYKFEELNEDQKQKAIENLWDINVDHEWWDGTYDDAKNVGIEITEFDIDRGSYCKGKFIHGAETVAEFIIKEHGENCETYKTAKAFLDELREAREKSDKEHNEKYPEFDEDFDESKEQYFDDNYREDLEDEFKKSILEDYRIILQKEYEYRTTKEAIIETIEANEYEFTEDGKLA